MGSKRTDEMLFQADIKIRASIDAEVSLRQKLEDKVLKEIEPELKALSRAVFNLTNRVGPNNEGNDPLLQRVQKLEALFNMQQRVQKLEMLLNGRSSYSGDDLSYSLDRLSYSRDKMNKHADEPRKDVLKQMLEVSLSPMQASLKEIRDEGNVRWTSISNLQLVVDGLRKDMESLVPSRCKQIESIRRFVVKTKEDIEKEIALRELDFQNFSTSIRELRKAAENVKQEHASNEELIRKLVLEEARVRVSQISKVEETCSRCRWDMEAELKSFKQTVDARVRQRREDDDALLHHVDEKTKAQASNHAGLETWIQKELHDWRQFQKNEKLEVNNFMQTMVARMNSQIGNLELNLVHVGQMLHQLKTESTLSDIAGKKSVQSQS